MPAYFATRYFVMCKQGSSTGRGPQWLNFVSHLIFNAKNGYGFTD